ncbi:MAG: glutathione peroxidase [Chitinophagaceae bacterium]|nr:glutathione peroxidase [Chitinophagaceae bacterium]
MTYRQKMLKAVYPALMWFTKLTGKNTKGLSNKDVIPPVSFYTLAGVLNNGDTVSFNSFRDKKVLLVNTASDCGYTNQYEDLQKLSEQYKDKLVVIGFPANDFKEQEKRADKDIAEFCKLNFGVTFPLMQKSIVIKSAQQNPVFQWLSDSTKNGWNKRYPSWNFSKYLVNEKGVLTNYFGSSVSPLSKEVVAAIME